MIRALPRPHKARGLDVSLAIINIVLLLIFFFLATGQLLNPPAPDIEISQTTELPIDQLPSPILVIRDDGTLELDGANIADENLNVAIRGLPTPLTLHVLIGRNAPATSLLEVLNRPALETAEIKLVTLRQTVLQ